jgi:hypothetical protein
MGNMNIHPNNPVGESSIKIWMKRMGWALPLFFFLKGLMWLVIPGLFLFFGLK